MDLFVKITGIPVECFKHKKAIAYVGHAQRENGVWGKEIARVASASLRSFIITGTIGFKILLLKLDEDEV